MANLRLALKMTLDGRELADGARQGAAEIGKVREAANDAAESLRQMGEGAVVSLDGVRRQAEEQKKAEAATLRAAAAYGQAVQDLDQLRRAYDPTYAAARRYADEVQKAERILAAANATDQERARILTAVAAAYDPVIRKVREAAAEEQRAAMASMTSFGEARNRLEQLKRSYDPVYAAQRRYADEVQAAERVLAAANATDEERATILRAVAEAYDPVIAAQRNAADAATKEAGLVRALIDQLDPAAASTRRLAEAQALLDRARAGEIEGVTLSEARYRALSRSLQDTGRSANDNAASVSKIGAAAGVSAGQMSEARRIITSNLINVGNVAVATHGDIASMASPLPDVIYGFRLMGGAVATVATVAATALAVIGGYLAAAASYSGSLHELERVNVLTGTAVGLTTDQLVRQGDSIADTAKVSRAAAREMEGAYLSTGRIGGDVLVKLADSTRDYAAATGQDLDKAKEELAGFFADPARAAEELTQRWGIYADAQRQVIKNYQAQGNFERAQQLLLDGLQPRIQGAVERMTWYAKALDWVKRSLSDIADTVGRTGAAPTLGETQDRRRSDLARIGDAMFPDLERQRQEPTRIAYYADTHDEREQAIQAAAAGTAQALQREIDQLMEFIRTADQAVPAEQALANAEKLVNEVTAKAPALRDAAARALAIYRDQLQQTVDPAAAFADAMERESRVLEAHAGRMRDFEAERQKILQQTGRQPGDQLTPDETANINKGLDRKYNAQAKDQHTTMVEATEDARVLAGATAAISPAAMVAAQARIAYNKTIRETTDALHPLGDKTKAQTAYDDAMAKGMAELSGQIGAAGTQSTLSTRQMLALAAAYEKGGAAVAETEAANRAELETLRAGTTVHSALGKAILEEEKAKRRLMAAQFDRDLVMQTDAAKALALAEHDGAKAVAEAQAANQAALQIEREGVATDSDRAKAILEKVKALAAWQEQQSYNREARQADQQIQLARLELSLQGQSEQVRQRTLELARYELQIREQFPRKTEEEIQALLQKRAALIGIQQEIERQGGAWKEIAGSLEKAFERIGDAAVQAMVEGKAAAIDWGNVARAVIASVVTDLVRMGAVRPFTNLVFGQNQPTLWDAFSGSRSSPANDQSFNGGGSSQLISAGNSLYNIYTGANTLGSLTSNFALSSYGTALGLSAAGTGAAIGTGGMVAGTGAGVAGAGANAAGVMGLYSSPAVTGLTSAGASTVGVAGTLGAVAPYGFLGGLAGAWLGNNVFGGSKVAAGLSGAALGAGSLAAGTAMMGGTAALAAIPVYGWIAAAVLAAVTSILGTSRPSVGPGGGGRVHIVDGAASLGAYGTDNGYDAENAKKLGEAGASLFNGLIQVGAGKLNKGDLGQDLLITHWAKDNKFQSELDGQIRKFDSVDEALIDGMRRLTDKLIAEGKLTFDNPDYLTALRNSTAKTTDDFIKDLGVGQNFRDMLAQLNGSYDPRSNWIKTATDAQKELGDQVKANLIDWRDRARNLGLATDDTLNPAILKGVKAMMGIGEAAQPIDLVVSAAEQARIKFEAFRPALAAIGQTAEEQQALLNQYVAAEQEAQAAAVRQITRRGEWAIEGAINANYRPTATERVADYGIDQRQQPTLATLSGALTTFFQEANAGTIGAERLRSVWGQLNSDLAAGRISTDQYNTVLQDLTQTYQDATSRATATAAALRSGRIAIEQAIDPNWRPNVDARLSDIGLSAAAITALRSVFRSVEDGASAGTVTAAQLRAALAGLDAQLGAGTITADQHRSAVSLLTSAWQESGQAAQQGAQGAQAVTSTWQSLLSTATQELSQQWQTISAAAHQASDAWAAANDNLERAGREILADTKYSNLGPQGIRDAAKAEFDRLAGIVASYREAVQAGTATDEQRKAALDAAGRLDAAGKQLLDAQNALSGDRTVYDVTLTQVRATWDSTRQLGLTLKSAEEARADQADQQLSRLEQLTGIGHEQRALLDQIKAAIGSGNGDLSQLVTLIRQVPGYQRYGAPADVQAAWSGLTDDARNSIARRIGYSGSASDTAFNDFIVANGKQGDFEALVRGWSPARGTPFAASASAQRAWDLMGDADRAGVARELGWQGSWSDREFNTFVVATGQQGRLEALLNGRGPANDSSGVAWLTDFMRRYHDALAQPEETQASIFRSMVDEKWRMLDALPASAFRSMDDLARTYTDSQISLNIEEVARRRGIPGFAAGGLHEGGARLVGERGWEMEVTGPARYWSHGQTRDILSPKAVTVDLAPVVVAVGGVRTAVLEIGELIRGVANQVAANTDAIRALQRDTQLLHAQIRKSR